MSFTIAPVIVPLEDRAQTRRYLTFGGLQVADVILTGIVLANVGHDAEGNPIIQGMLNSTGLIIGLALLLAFKLGATALLWACQSPVRIVRAVYVAVILNNALAVALIAAGRWS